MTGFLRFQQKGEEHPPLLSFVHPITCAQVAPQQSLLPFHLASYISNHFLIKIAAFLTTLS